MLETDEFYLKHAVDLATTNVYNGGGPFGAIVVLPDGRIYEGINRVTDKNDPTAHAEVTAIRNACSELGNFVLTGATLYTSCEPCPMCLGAALWSRVDRIVFAANQFDAADAGFDDAEFYRLLRLGNLAEELVLEDKLAPFNAWKESTTKTEY